MRISDWSSDVCSSDLCNTTRNRLPLRFKTCVQLWKLPHNSNLIEYTARSEEHTSELQSLMRISYAVFCLKKKNTSNNLATSFSTLCSYSYIIANLTLSHTSHSTHYVLTIISYT